VELCLGHGLGMGWSEGAELFNDPDATAVEGAATDIQGAEDGRMVSCRGLEQREAVSERASVAAATVA
jgi:hypothetical protein